MSWLAWADGEELTYSGLCFKWRELFSAFFRKIANMSFTKGRQLTMYTTEDRHRKLIIPILILAICSVMGLFTGRHFAQSAPVPRPVVKESPEMATITIHTPLAKASATQVRVAPGDSFTITLPSNPTTGYSWKLGGKLPAGLLKSMGSRYQAPAAGRIGQGGVEDWEFQVLRKGTTKITFEYARPWEKGAPPVKRGTFTIIAS
jgi:predicted secreted protein